jgi:hypothetical protein
VSSIKSTSPCCNDRDRSRKVQQSHSPVKLEPLEAGGLGDHGDGVKFFLCIVCCCVCERRLVLGCPPLAYNISYYGIVLGVGISIVVLDTYAILVKYSAREYGGREKK